MHEEQLVPRGGGARRASSGSAISASNTPASAVWVRLMAPTMKCGGILPPGPCSRWLWASATARKVEHEALLDPHLRRLPEPPAETVLPALDALPIG